MLDPAVLHRLDALLADDDRQRAARYPGLPPTGQPVHTVYVPADRYGPHTVDEWRAAALAALDRYGPLPGVADALAARVRAKLAAEPIEDLRIDFEDGYGVRGDAEEDAAVRAAATALARGPVPRHVGLRIKSLEPATRRRAVRTLDLFLDALLRHRSLPDGFRVTLPKVTSLPQVEAMVQLCAELEAAHRLPPLRFEIQVETPQAVLGADGTATVARMVHAAAGRCVGLHYGTYDYSAALGVAAGWQSLEHPVADHAKAVLQVAAAGTGVAVSDGSTNVLPTGDRAAVHAGWALHLRLVRRSLERGLYQGWDLHPGQLPTRFAATFAFYRDGLPAAAGRLRAYLDRVDSGILDEPATARALAGFLLRGLDCGALNDAEVVGLAGVDRSHLRETAGGRPMSLG
ncbi:MULTISPECIES: DUF6986 family protein [Micromonospora]|uniref:DUF6986 family protein n=1 Tax=Micromonospora TaxID=1873 RepID=UPI001E2A63F0|nr:aldolase/citrate lyase family protein [Micromonospora sp. NBRC 110038]